MLTLPAEITYACAARCLPALTAAVQKETGAVVRVDATPLARFDSSALSVLLALRRVCSRAGKRFVAENLAPHLQELAALYGVSALLLDTPA